MDGAHSGCFQELKICQEMFCSGRREEIYDVDLRSIFHDFLHQASSFVPSTAVCYTTFPRDLLFLLLNPYQIISTATDLQVATQREVA